jgi:hypothetical protein
MTQGNENGVYEQTEEEEDENQNEDEEMECS